MVLFYFMDTTNETLSQAADTIFDRAVTFSVEIIRPTWVQRLKKERVKNFAILPATLGTMTRISKELLEIDGANFRKEDLLNSNFELMANNAERMARIIAIAANGNSSKPPSKELIHFFLKNITAKELLGLVEIVLKQIDTVNFLNSIILARGINVLKMNPKTQGSEIASGTPSGV